MLSASAASSAVRARPASVSSSTRAITTERPRRRASSYTKRSSCGMPATSDSSSVAPTAAPPAPKSSAPMMPEAMMGPMPGIIMVTAAPSGKPTAAPAPAPTTAPMARPTPGRSPSSTGTTLWGSTPGESSVMRSRGIPSASSWAAARSASPRVAKMPATVCMAEASCGTDEQWRCQRRRPALAPRAAPCHHRHRSPSVATGRIAMRLSRRTFLAGTAALAATTAAAPYVHAQKKGGTLRFVPHADLKILDPIWTTAYITRNHGYMIFDTLFALDENLKLQPQMVDKFTVSKDAMKYSFTLRDGLKFHDGQPVTAEDCVASIKRWGAKDAMGRLLIASLSRMASTDRKTFVIELETPFGLVLDALGKPSASPSFIMPARVAATDPNEQVKDIIGSGPYRFSKDEWQPGNRVVYVRNADYVPRREAPSGAAGAKRALVDRVEWRYIPDAATAGAALEAGEVDYWENVPLDFAPRLESNQNLSVFVTDPRGSQGILRPNHLHPPFNNKKARQALLLAVDQKSYLQAVIGNEKYFKTCPSVFMCGGLPYESSAGAPKPDLERARALFKESGYDGRPVVVLDPT